MGGKAGKTPPKSKKPGAYFSNSILKLKNFGLKFPI